MKNVKKNERELPLQVVMISVQIILKTPNLKSAIYPLNAPSFRSLFGVTKFLCYANVTAYSDLSNTWSYNKNCFCKLIESNLKYTSNLDSKNHLT